MKYRRCVSPSFYRSSKSLNQVYLNSRPLPLNSINIIQNRSYKDNILNFYPKLHYIIIIMSINKTGCHNTKQIRRKLKQNNNNREYLFIRIASKSEPTVAPTLQWPTRRDTSRTTQREDKGRGRQRTRIWHTNKVLHWAAELVVKYSDLTCWSAHEDNSETAGTLSTTHTLSISRPSHISVVMKPSLS